MDFTVFDQTIDPAEQSSGNHDPASSADVNDGSAMGFGEFRVMPRARSLTRSGVPVCIGSRAFDLLVVLLRARGRLVTKDQIVREVWPAIFVDESNLRFQMGVLRKALGPACDWIKTIPGRGYLFIGEDTEATSVEPTVSRPVQTQRSGLFPNERVILVVEPNTEDRNAMTALLRALKVSVLSFRSVEEVAAFARPDALAIAR